MRDESGTDRGIPRPIEWLIGLPSVARTVMGTPVRLIQLPWKSPSTGRGARVYARRYLELRPHGEHEDETRYQDGADEHGDGGTDWSG